jgi:hypothetical protein
MRLFPTLGPLGGGLFDVLGGASGAGPAIVFNFTLYVVTELDATLYVVTELDATFVV